MQGKNYIGITIGPITRTMSFSSAPGGLWFASYFFSMLSKKIVEELKERDAEILTIRKDGEKIDEKFYDEKNAAGLGIFHDRIYATVDAQFNNNTADDLIEGIEKQLAKSVSDAINKPEKDVNEFLKDYLQIHYIIVSEKETETKGIAKTLADALDALELNNKISNNKGENYLRKLMEGNNASNASQNTYIKNWRNKIGLDDKEDKSGLISENNKHIRSVPEISSQKELDNNKSEENLFDGMPKYSKYYALVYADGDNMGKIIASTASGNIETQKNGISEFSKLCTEYSEMATEKITNYGGVVIYSGGDDLLFIAPVFGKDDSNIWKLCKDISDGFKKLSKDFEDKNPSISFGISINYYKYPLYEAMEDAASMLFGIAKNYYQKIITENEELWYGELAHKNNIATHLTKHSGQSQQLVCYMGSGIFDDFINLINYVKGDNIDVTDEFLHSLTYSIENKKAILNAIAENENTGQLNKFIDNLFRTKKCKDEIKTTIKSIAEKMMENEFHMGTSTDEENFSFILSSMLRIVKFTIERK